MDIESLFKLHEGLPRGGPGSDDSTLAAIKRLPALPAAPRILDIGCGPGQQTIVLARELQGKTTAIDVYPPFLDACRDAARTEDLGHLVETRDLSMDALDFDHETFDLIWSEGTVYIIGVEAALRLWRPFLKPGAIIAFSEATWLTDNPPHEAKEYWAEAYPVMATTQANEATAEALGYEPLDRFTLPASDWMDEYYGPLKERMAETRNGASAEMAETIDETLVEIDMYERFGDSYGYVFYILRKTG
ncbi:MAG: methyltransferase domain-containing protein [Rhodospirillales bacterium]|jgi:SAM-dependent methyltransferase|nr:methyltransferase domain-containing protein [Rhodospirillales bacterium]